MRIPNWTYLRVWPERRDGILKAIEEVLSSGRVILGPKVEAFERAWANYVGTSFCAGVANGTDAIELALRACGIKPGDRVVTVPNTAVPTVAAIVATGAVPVFVDIDPGTYLMDTNLLEKVCAQKDIRAIVPVHLYGQAVEMNEVMRVADKFGLWVVEDCAQAHGCTYKGKRVGSIGHVGAWSFYPTKILGAMGDAGAITTSDAFLDEQIRLMREYGMKGREYYSYSHGTNSRLDEIQAAILLEQLKWLDKDVQSRRSFADRYGIELEGTSVLPEKDDGHVFHQYVIRVKDRDCLIRDLAEDGIELRVHYPTPIHYMNAYSWIAGKSDCPNTVAASKEIVSLPMFPGISHDEIETVCERVQISR